MNTKPDYVIDQIARHGGTESARLLAALIPRYFRRNPESASDQLTPDLELTNLLNAIEGNSGQTVGVDPFNLIPAAGIPGACCPLALAIAPAGFGASSSPRRPNFNQLALELSAYWLRCYAINRETLLLTPEWNQRSFDTRFTGLFAAYRDTGRQAFIVEVARTGLILRWPY